MVCKGEGSGLTWCTCGDAVDGMLGGFVELGCCDGVGEVCGCMCCFSLFCCSWGRG